MNLFTCKNAPISIVTYNHTKDHMDNSKKQESITKAGYFLLLPPTLKFFLRIQGAIGLSLHFLKNTKLTL